MLLLLLWPCCGFPAKASSQPLRGGVAFVQQLAETDQVTPNNQSDRMTNTLQIVELVNAFRTALGSLKGKVALANADGRIVVRWQNPDSWLVQIDSYPDAPPEGLSIFVKTNGTVTVSLTKSGDSASVWLATAKGGKADTKGKLRPEVAFQRGMQHFGEHSKSVDLRDVRGCITLSRAAGNDGWFIDVSRFRNMHFGGTWIRVMDDGSLESMGGL